MLKRGKRPVILKGYHGQVSFMLQDYVDKCGHRNNYLALSNQFLEGGESVRLRAFICKYSNQLSYEEVANLVKEVAGFETVSGQHCFNIVQSVANAVVISQEFAMVGNSCVFPFWNPLICMINKKRNS